MKLCYEAKPDELLHYGVPGMKWGVRRAVRGHAGPGRYLTKKRQLAGDKKDLEYLNKGGHLSVGLTKKRQAAYDARDKEALERRIEKTSRKIYDAYLEQQQREKDKSYKKVRFDTIVSPDVLIKKHKRLKKLDEEYKHDTVERKYKSAINKAKINPKYKDTPEYKKVMKDYGKQRISNILKDLFTVKKPDNPYKHKPPKHGKDF